MLNLIDFCLKTFLKEKNILSYFHFLPLGAFIKACHSRGLLASTSMKFDTLLKCFLSFFKELKSERHSNNMNETILYEFMYNIII